MIGAGLDFFQVIFNISQGVYGPAVVHVKECPHSGKCYLVLVVVLVLVRCHNK